MTCPGEWRRSQAADGALSTGKRVALEKHLRECARCAAEVRTHKEINRLLAPAAEVALPAGFMTRAARIPDATPIRAAFPPRVAVLAAVALLCVTGWLALREKGTHRTEGGRPQALSSAAAPVAAPVATPVPPSPPAPPAEVSLVALHRRALEDDLDVARAAISRLAELRRRESMPALTAAVAMPDRTAGAISALAALGDPAAVAALGPILEAGTHDDLVLAALVELGGEEAATWLDRRIRAGGEVARFANALGRIGAAAELLDLRDDALHADLVATVAVRHVTALVPGLTAAAARDDRALDLLADLAPPAAVPALRKLLADRDRRPAVARTLARIATPAAARAIFELSRDARVREQFREAGPGVEAWLIARLETAETDTRHRLIDLLGLCGGDPAVAALADLARNPGLAPRVIASLAEIESASAVAALAEISNEPRFRRETIAALAEMGSRAAVPVIVRLAEQDRSLRGEALRALRMIPDAGAVRGIVLLTGRTRCGAALQALRGMDQGLVETSLCLMLEGDLAPQARRALHELGVGPPAAGSSHIY